MHQQNQSQNEERKRHSPNWGIPVTIVVGKLLKNKWTKPIIMMLGVVAILILIWLSLPDAELRQSILYPLVIYVLIQGIEKIFAHREGGKNK